MHLTGYFTATALKVLHSPYWDGPQLNSGYAQNKNAFSPVNYPLSMEVFQATADFGRIENSPWLFKSCFSHVIDVELQVSTIHESQDQAERIFCFIGIGQTHLQ